MNIFAELERDCPLGSRRTGIGISGGMAFGRQPAEDAMKRMLFADGDRNATAVLRVGGGGGELVFTMGDKPSKFGTQEADRP